ncbi:zf-HC2 domain-containing protein [Candidatus Omnitrophota bacterium]
MDCLSEKRLSSYLDEGLSEVERGRIEDHISRCNHCLDLLMLSYEARGASGKCPALLKQKIGKTLGLKEEKKRPESKWFFGALILFALSFVFKGFFLQFLAGAVILGFKWVMEGEGARRVVMIFRGMQKEEKKFERKSPPPVSDITGGDKYGEGR